MPNDKPEKTVLNETEPSRHLVTIGNKYKELISEKMKVQDIKDKLIAGEITATKAIELVNNRGLEENTELLDYIAKWSLTQEQQKVIADATLVEIAVSKGYETKDRINAAKILRGEQNPAVQFNQQINVHKENKKQEEKNVYADIPVTTVDWQTSKDIEEEKET